MRKMFESYDYTQDNIGGASSLIFFFVYQLNLYSVNQLCRSDQWYFHYLFRQNPMFIPFQRISYLIIDDVNDDIIHGVFEGDFYYLNDDYHV